MILRPRSSPLIPWLTALLLAGALAGSATAGFVVEPTSRVTVIPVGDKDYYRLDQEPVLVLLQGPGRLYGYARAGFAPGETGTKSGTIMLQGVGERTIRLPLNFEPSSVSTWGDESPGRPSKGRQFEFYIPKGMWSVRVSGVQPEGALLAANLYYDGPRQPTAGAVEGDARVRESPWRYRNQFGVEVIYDDNVITQSDDGVDAWIDGVTPEQFRIGAIEDLLVAPWLDFAAERSFWDFGKTRFRFKIKRWMYTQNPIKTNTDLNWYIRQYFPGGKSLELFVHYAPEQFIRMLSDRPPYSDPDEPIEYKEFRFTRNVINLNWRHRLSKKFDYQVIVETNMRYYNKPFIENDIEAWEIRGSLGYKVHKRLKLSFDYSYEDAKARGLDSSEEDSDHNDDGDASYRRDLYRVGFAWTTRWARPFFDSIDGSYLFMDYYYPTSVPLFDDPYHVGRRDKVTKVSVSLSKRINRTISVYGDFRYSERAVESPYYGDITLDKDYIQHRYWVGMTYRF